LDLFAKPRKDHIFAVYFDPIDLVCHLGAQHLVLWDGPILRPLLANDIVNNIRSAPFKSIDRIHTAHTGFTFGPGPWTSFSSMAGNLGLCGLISSDANPFAIARNHQDITFGLQSGTRLRGSKFGDILCH
jgi:hypothetical protein